MVRGRLAAIIAYNNHPINILFGGANGSPNITQMPNTYMVNEANIGRDLSQQTSTLPTACLIQFNIG